MQLLQSLGWSAVKTMSPQRSNYSELISTNARIIFYLQPQVTLIQVWLNDSYSNLTNSFFGGLKKNGALARIFLFFSAMVWFESAALINALLSRHWGIRANKLNVSSVSFYSYPKSVVILESQGFRWNTWLFASAEMRSTMKATAVELWMTLTRYSSINSPMGVSIVR